MNIIPIKYLKDTNKIYTMAYAEDDPIFVTKNGHEALVILSAQTYKKRYALNFVERNLTDNTERKLSEGFSLKKVKVLYNRTK